MATFYIATTGNASNSGSTDADAPTVSGAAATVAGSVVTLDGSPDLSATITAAGLTQSTIYINDATNANQKIFKITAFDDTANTVTVSVAPTGVTSSAWRIGGRLVWTPANIEAAIAAGDVIEFQDSPASSASTLLTCRANGTAGARITVRGITGSRPALTHTGTASVIECASLLGWRFSNLELIHSGASGNNVNAPHSLTMFENIKFNDGAVQIGNVVSTAINIFIVDCEFTAFSSQAIVIPTATMLIERCYIHDGTGDGILVSGNAPIVTIEDTIIDTCTGRGIYSSGASISNGLLRLNGVVVYGCGNSGLEVTDADLAVYMSNCIFSENGNAANEYNIEWLAGTAEASGIHQYNCFFHTSGAGSNLSLLTANSTEIVTDPLFTNPAGGDFTLQSGSPCKGTGTPGLLGIAGGTGYRDMGALQRQESAAGVTARVIGE